LQTLRPRTYKYEPGPDSKRFHACEARHVVCIAPARSGKTFTLRHHVLEDAWNNPTDWVYLVCGPIYQQVKQTWMRPLIEMAKRLGIYKHHVYSPDNMLILKNGKVILFRSLNVPDTGIRSLDVYRLVIDEWTLCDKYACAVAEARLVLPESRSWKIATPKGTTNWVYHEHFGPDAKEHPNTDYIEFSILNNPVMTEEEVERMASEMDPLFYQQEVLAKWVNLTEHKIYHSFDYAQNVSEITERDGQQWYIGLDYNIDINAWVGCQYDPQLRVISVLYEGFGDRTTADAGRRILQQFGSTVFIADDASGRSRQQGDGKTQRELLNQVGLYSIAGNISNPRIERRHSVVNAHLLNGIGVTHLFIHPRCKRLIHELDNLTRKPNSMDVDTQGGKVGHITDALGYVVFNLSGGTAGWGPASQHTAQRIV